MQVGEVYFWTSTIKDWKHLLRSEQFKLIIIEQLQWLQKHDKIVLYAYVIMPNHLHFIWEMKGRNGKEMPHASFNKWTSHQFLNILLQDHPQVLPYFSDVASDRKYHFWQRDALAIQMDSGAKLEQKLEYLHNNPLQEKWNLAERPEDYRWSSARFYMSEEDEFGILTHYRERF
jgi:REP element-mobilizing transposase RayT